MRLYFDLSRSDPILDEICQLACSDPKLDLCKVSQLPGNPMTDARKVFPMNWRFFSSLDPQVKFFTSWLQDFMRLEQQRLRQEVFN